MTVAHTETQIVLIVFFFFSIYSVKSHFVLKTFSLRALVINSGMSDTSFKVFLCSLQSHRL